MPPSRVAIGTFDVTLNDAGTAVDNAFDSAAGTDRFAAACATWNDAAGHTDVTFAYNAVSFSNFGSVIDQNNCKQRSAYLANPATGSNTFSVDTGAEGTGNAACVAQIAVYQDVDVGGTPFDGYTSANNVDTTSPYSDPAVTLTSAVGDLGVFMYGAEFAATATAFAATNFTEGQENHNSTVSGAWGDADGAASIASSGTWTVGFGNCDWVAEAFNLNAAAGGGGGIVGPLVGGYLTRSHLIGGRLVT